MPQQLINLGAAGSGAGGDSARTAFEKAIANFAELYLQKADLASPVFTGDPKAPTPPTTDNDTSIATTSFVRAVMASLGLGTASNLVAITADVDTLTDSGTYWLNGSSANKPMAQSGQLVVVAAPNLNTNSQFFYAHMGSASPRLFFRHKNSGTGLWNPWRELFHAGNILGTVSQSGGVPTGAIIERGSNANGEYVRFADGTQICTRRVSALSLASLSISASGAGGGFRSGENPVAFAASFAAPPVTSVALTNNAQNVFATCYAASSSAWSVVFRTAGTAVVITDAFTVELKAEGRWY
jgi:hypothetical protein